MKKIVFAGLLAIMFAFAGCTTIDPHTATSNAVGSKVGESSYSALFGTIPLPFSGDASIQTAAANGGITKISTVDRKTYSLLGLWVVYTTIVTGE